MGSEAKEARRRVNTIVRLGLTVRRPRPVTACCQPHNIPLTGNATNPSISAIVA